MCLNLNLYSSNKNNIMPETKPKDKYQTNESKSSPQKVNEDLPDLPGGLESSTRSTEHNPSSARVFYCSPNRALKQVALTFDDGPDVCYIPQILEILEKNNVKAAELLASAVLTYTKNYLFF